MFCINCGTQINDGMAFCHKCGKQIQPTEFEHKNKHDFEQKQQTPIPTTHIQPRCTCCGTVNRFKYGPLLRTSDIVWIMLLLFLAGAGFIYLIYILIMRFDPKKREQVCMNCGSINMLTYYY